eukprot:gene34912-43051_t
MAQAWVGHIRGGLGYVAIGAAVLMASMSGSALADTAALATILLPMMRQQGYPMNTSAGLIASGGIIAPIIPPSMPFVIYGVTTNTSISALFVSGIVPGLMMGAGLIFAWRWVLRDLDLPKGEPLPVKDRLRATARAFWAMLMPLIIIGGMKSGVFTPTEAAVVAAFYALVVALFIHREMRVPEIYGVLVRAAKTTSIVMFLCAGAQVASYMITLADLPNVLTNWLGPLVQSPRLLMAVMMIVLVLIGRQAIVSLQRYLERQKAAEALSDRQRRETLQYDVALARLAKSVCPGCERKVDLKDPAIDFCPHCGIGLYDHCGSCQTRKNAFSRFCHACGTAAQAAPQ